MSEAICKTLLWLILSIILVTIVACMLIFGFIPEHGYGIPSHERIFGAVVGMDIISVAVTNYKVFQL